MTLLLQFHKNGLGGWSMVPLPLRSVHQSLAPEHGCLNFPITLSARVAKMRHIFTFCAAVDDSSSHLPRRSDGEETVKIRAPGKDGLLQRLKNVFARRTAQKEELINSLRRYGVAGILSYGLLNTLYYLVAFLLVWFYVAPSPGGLGFVPAAKRFVQVFATVWAGSQVTKLLRAAGALSLAPLVDRGLNWYMHRFNFKSRGMAFGFIVGACFGLAAVVFLAITTLWS